MIWFFNKIFDEIHHKKFFFFLETKKLIVCHTKYSIEKYSRAMEEMLQLHVGPKILY